MLYKKSYFAHLFVPSGYNFNMKKGSAMGSFDGKFDLLSVQILSSAFDMIP